MASARSWASRAGGPDGARPAWCSRACARGPPAFDTAGAIPARSPPRVASHRRASASQSIAAASLPLRDCRYSSAARLARCSTSWNACSRPAQYAAACWSPPIRARRSFSRREACSTEIDLENETVTS